MKEYTFKFFSPEWFQLRNKHITGTEIASLFGLNKFKSATQLMKEKVQGFEEGPKDKTWFKNGKKYTTKKILAGGRKYEEKVIKKLQKDGFLIFPAADKEEVKVITLGNISVSLDAKRIFHTVEGNGHENVEIKTTKEEFEKYKQGIIKSVYLLQCQTQLLISGHKEMLLVCAEQSKVIPYIIFDIEENKELQEILIDTVNRFWDNKIKGEKFKINQDDKKRIINLLPETVSFCDL